MRERERERERNSWQEEGGGGGERITLAASSCQIHIEFARSLYEKMNFIFLPFQHLTHKGSFVISFSYHITFNEKSISI